MTDQELLRQIDELRNAMIAVATGGPRIRDADEGFRQIYQSVAGVLKDRNVSNPLPYASLWDWYGRWSSGDLPTYQSRRTFVSELFDPLVEQIGTGQKVRPEPTGWPRVDRAIGEIRERLSTASAEEHFQVVGMLCREALISVAQAVYAPDRHPSRDGVAPSDTDAKRMFDAFFSHELPGSSNEEGRRHARSALELSLALHHKRTATFREAALCAEATSAVVNIVVIISGRRDP